MTAIVRKRRPAFDRENGVAVAMRLFHERGYDAVSIADLTAALGIVPPSLYAAYGSKAELFERAMRLYVSGQALPLQEILSPEKAPSQALTDLLVQASYHYTRDDKCRGCMVTEGMRADDPIAKQMAAAIATPGCDYIHDYIFMHNPKGARRITDYVLLTLRGLSSYACLGRSGEHLAECARMASRSLLPEFNNLEQPAGAVATV